MKPADAEKKRQRKEKREKDRLNLSETVTSKTETYTVVSLIGSGGFGDVYKVLGTANGAEYALKTESTSVTPAKSRLKTECRILEEIRRIRDPAKKEHFLTLIDQGRTDQYKYIVMDLVGPSLNELRKRNSSDFLPQTVVQIALQTLAAVRDLHAIGFLHRDMKPHNFAIGLPPRDSLVFMLDFGLARRFLDDDGMLRPPRAVVPFTGTVRFASRAALRNEDHRRHDDLETWLYTVMEMFNVDNLPWRRLIDKKEVLASKENFMANTKDPLTVPSDFVRIKTYINGLRFVNEPDYVFVDQLVNEAAKRNKFDLKAPLEWARSD